MQSARERYQQSEFDTSSSEYIRIRDHYSVRHKAIQELAELVNPDNGFSDEEKEEFLRDNPDVAKEKATRDAIEATFAHLKGSLYILKTGKPESIPRYAAHTVEAFKTELGREPDIYDAEQFTTAHALYIALQTRGLVSTKVDEDIESQICEGVSAKLIEEGDLSLLHPEASGYSDETLLRNIPQMLEPVNEMLTAQNLEPISQNYLTAKLAYLHRGSIVGAARSLRINSFEHAHTPEVTAMRGEQNTAFAHRMRAIRQYGIKSLAFDFTDTVSDSDAVIEDASKVIDISGHVKSKGLFDFALVRIIQADLDDHDKFQATSTASESGLNTVTYTGLRSVIAIDRDGELYTGGLRKQGSVSMRRLYQRTDQLHLYEALRAKLLTQVFDSIAPASLVDAIEAKTESESTAPAHIEPSRDSSDVVYQMMVPRIRTLQGTTKQIKALFDTYLKEEEQESHRTLRLHDVTSHLRKIPTNARPSSSAIAESKRAFGDDYELPEGYTFVRSHERGDRANGKVVGHLALQRTVQLAH